MVALTPDDIRALTGSRAGSTPPSVPDCLPVVSSGLRRDSAKEVVGISVGQTAVLQNFVANVRSRAEAESDRTKLDRAVVDADDGGAGTEDENTKSAVEVESDKSVGIVVGAEDDKGCGQVKNNKLPIVSLTAYSSCASVSEHISTFVRASSLASPLTTANISKECSVGCGSMVTSEQQTSGPDVSVGAKCLEPHNKTDSILPGATVPGPGLPDASLSHTLSAAAVCPVSPSQDVRAETVEGNAEACLRGVRVKQERSSEHGDDDDVEDNDLSVYAIAVDERLQESEDVKVDPEVMP